MELEADSGGSKINQTDVLPAASAIISFLPNLDLRLGYGDTVSRPSFREKAPIANFLPDLGVIAYGSPDLQITSINSYDARLEWFPNPGDLVSVGVFYKSLELPIELYSITLTDDVVTWINRSTGADVMGLEFEARKSLEFIEPRFKGFTLGANVTLIKSDTELSPEELAAKSLNDPNPATSRPLYDQSPYIINLDLSYQHPTSGTSFTLGANLTGERIVLAKLQGPDIYEHPPVSLDVLISQRLSKNFTLRFGVRNLLNPESLLTYGEDAGGNIYQSYERGRTFSLSLAAEF